MQHPHDITFGKFLSIILRHGQMYLDKELASLHIRAGQIPILRLLAIRDGISQERIRKYFHLDKGTIARTIKPLVSQGYVLRKTDPRDRRAYQILLLPKGREIIPGLKEAVRGWTDILTAGFSEKEKEMVHTLLSRMSDNAHEYFENQTSAKN
jgi:DNA-binding MarR family transcriptional regulator